VHSSNYLLLVGSLSYILDIQYEAFTNVKDRNRNVSCLYIAEKYFALLDEIDVSI